ncbi:type II secretion system F family protein [Paenibacillus sp. TRM 82003]|uniref:type II secretion system F family protein n=1 Tax=Kineococcus sp. TRM81007 TaxID=2925831 RepID=UPI001F578E4B|nr:type II secretion system F family protein [Kineococcus sp. TRM81007]MCI2239775.1 type II secretion system F family protein [Kineococcus sp. TRM81007]MCI3925921.1 type II secretion system F family protein [Paenibacillus sp. TRM 82003]
MSPAATGALLGLLGGAGCVLVLLGVPLRRTPSLESRVAPYLVRPAVPGWRASAGRRLRAAVDACGAVLGSPAVVRARLDVLDPDRDVAEHRAEQVLWALGGAGAAAVLCAVVLLRGALTPVGALAFVVAGTVGGALLRDAALARAVRRRRALVEEDLPAVAELLALSVGAGEGVAAALQRVAAGGGELAVDLRRALARVGTGTPLVEALTATADRLGVAALGRFVDGLVVAVETGSPLAAVLRAQAADAREAERRRLLEEGGRREVRMLVPVVFGVLPVTVLFAVFPGLAQLSLGS